MHAIVGGPNLGPAGPTSPTWTLAVMFGSIFMMDNPLTAAPDLNLILTSRAQGIYTMSSQHDEFNLLMMLTCNFVSRPYNGSSFSIVSRNPVMREVRDMPIVGGIGMFRLTQDIFDKPNGCGYCI